MSRPQSVHTLVPPRPFDRSRRQSSFNSLLAAVPEDSDTVSLTASSYNARPADRQEPGEWTLDLSDIEARRREWKSTERVILVLGEYSPAALHPLLTDPLFSHTLILLGCMRAKEPLPPPASGAKIHQLPPPQWAHCTIQQVVERAVPIAAAYRKKHRPRSLFRSTKFTGQMIDCVINILSPTLRFDPRQAMSKLLREVVMSTTAVLASVPAKEPIRLVQVLPTSYPAPLPSVVERYLCSISQTSTVRPIALAQTSFTQERLPFAPIEALLFNILSWTATYESANSASRRAIFLPGWSAVNIESPLSPSPSYLSDMSRRGSAASTDEQGPVTPSGSSDTVDRSTIHSSEDPYATLRSLPAQRSRLSYVQTAPASPTLTVRHGEMGEGKPESVPIETVRKNPSLGWLRKR